MTRVARLFAPLPPAKNKATLRPDRKPEDASVSGYFGGDESTGAFFGLLALNFQVLNKKG